MSGSTKPTTLGELKASGYESRSVREEMRHNLMRKLSNKEEVFPGIIGYQDRHGGARIDGAEFIAQLRAFGDRDFSGLDLKPFFRNEHAGSPGVGGC